MSQKKSLSEKLGNFIWGEPVAGLSPNDLNTIRHLDGQLNELLALLKTPPSLTQPRLV